MIEASICKNNNNNNNCTSKVTVVTGSSKGIEIITNSWPSNDWLHEHMR
ncbi:MAG: hypothetical protein ACJ70U_09520 [Nitrososphaera sp.]